MLRRLGMFLALAGSLASWRCSVEKPLQPPPMKETDNIVHWVDTITDTDAGTYIAGWAFIERVDTACSEVFVVLKAGDTQGMFPAAKVPRPDVSKNFNNPGLDGSGFSVLIKRGLMRKGEYRLGLYIKRDTQQALQFTAKTVTLR